MSSRSRSAVADLERFDKAERIVHWSTAVLLISLLVTGAILYVPTFTLAVGHRAVVEQVHVVTGLALPGPLVLGLAGPWRRHLLSDIRRLDRWTAIDWAWWRSPRSPQAGRGKFNGGQKAEAALLGGGMLVMVLTGVVMRWSPPFPSQWATGATFLHDVGFVALALAVLSHVAVALSKPDQMSSMLSGRIPRSWAVKHAPGWLEELEGESGPESAEEGSPTVSAPAPPRSQPSAPPDGGTRADT